MCNCNILGKPCSCVRPLDGEVTTQGTSGVPLMITVPAGITKREYFAAHVIQGIYFLMARDGGETVIRDAIKRGLEPSEHVAKLTMIQVDELIKELAK